MARVISTTPTTGKKVLFVDVMLHDRFIFTLRYQYCPLFKLDLQDVYSKVIEKRHSLKGKPIEIWLD